MSRGSSSKTSRRGSYDSQSDDDPFDLRLDEDSGSEEEQVKPERKPREVKEERITEEELEAILNDDDLIEIEEDEYIKSEPIRKPLGQSGFRASQSKSRGSPVATVDLKINYRPTSRPTKKDEPDFNDLWEVFGKYLSKQHLEIIFEHATNLKDVQLFNEIYNTDYEPAPIEFASKKTNRRAFKKEIYVARTLLSPVARAMAVQKLKTLEKTDKSNPVLPGDFSLSDEDVFIQFTPDGPTFPGDSPDTPEMEEAAGVISSGSDGKRAKNVRAKEVRIDSDQIPFFVPMSYLNNSRNNLNLSLVEALSDAVASDEAKEEADSERVSIVKGILKNLALMDIDTLLRTEEEIQEIMKELEIEEA